MTGSLILNASTVNIKKEHNRMKNFILGIVTTLIVGFWVILAIVGTISVKAAILIPVGIIIGLLIAVWLFGLLWNS